MSAILSARGLGCERGGRQLWSDWNFELQEGSLWRVGGANGSGKSTFLRVLAGLHRDHRGRLDGVESFSVMYLGHAPGLKLELSATRNLQLLQAAHFIDIGDAAAHRDYALEALGLEARLRRRALRRLSAGQRQRAALARFLLRPARLWLLDEPFASLDDDGVGRVRAMLAAHAAVGGVAVISEPNAAEQGLSLQPLALPLSSASAPGAADAARAEVGGIWSPLKSAMRRDARLLRLSAARAALFFLLAATPVAFMAPTMTAASASATLWALALLALLIGGDELAAEDLADGSLDQRLLAPAPLWLPANARILALWLVTAAPLTLMTPVAGLMLGLPAAASAALAGGVFIGGFGLAGLAATASALLAPASRGGALLLPMLLLPLALPAPVFGVGAAHAALEGQWTLMWSALSGLLAWSLLAMALLPPAIAAAWRLHRE